VSESEPNNPPDVFRYTNYREYLRDYFAYEKSKQRGFSYRAFSKRAGVGAPNHLQRVIECARNLSPKLASKFAHACRLTGDDATYFVLLVSFNQARQPAAKQKAYNKIAKMRQFQQTHQLAAAHAAYFGAWYLPAIRELVTRADFQEDPYWIAHTLTPHITLNQARSGLELLIELGIVVRNSRGKLKQAKPLVSTGNEVTAFQFAQFHREMMRLAGESITTVPRDKRDLSVLTLGVSKTGLAKIKQRLQVFRKEMLEIASSEKEVAQIVQLNFQLFPLSNDGDT